MKSERKGFMGRIYCQRCLLITMGTFLIVWGVSGCVVPQLQRFKQPELEHLDVKKRLLKERVVTPPGPPPFKEKLAPVAQELFQDQKIFSMTFENATLGEVLKALASQSALNMVVDSEVDTSRSITVQLKRVTFQEALDMVVKNGAGYTWKIENGCLHVKRFEERIYHLNYLDIIGETSIEVGGDMLASSVEDSGVAGNFEIKAKREKKNVDVWQSVETALAGLKSSSGLLQINRNAGVIYMADTPRRLKAMVDFLDSLTESLNRQVFIESKIVEVTLDDANKYGIDWNALDLGLRPTSSTLPDAMNVTFNSGNIVLSDKTHLNFIFDFLESQGDVSVLSNPHLSLMNGQSALMTVGVQFPYGDVDGVERDSQTGVVTFGTSIKRAVLGLQLGITSQIAANGIVTLNIVPTITRIQKQQDVELPTSTTSTQTISNPVIDLQELSTTVRVREGNTIVLAGLISRIKQMEHKGLPFLSDIPYIGNFFKNIQETTQNRELIIFITPYIKKVS